MDMSIQFEPVKVEKACQTEETFATSPQRFISTSLRDVCHALQQDHSYPSLDKPAFPDKESASVPEDSEAKQALEFPQNKSVYIIESVFSEEEIKTECPLNELSESGESEISDSESDFDFDIDDEDSLSDGGKCDDDCFMKTEHPQEAKTEGSKWLNENCGDIQEECKFIVF